MAAFYRFMLFGKQLTPLSRYSSQLSNHYCKRLKCYRCTSGYLNLPVLLKDSSQWSVRNFSTSQVFLQSKPETSVQDEGYHSIIKDQETAQGPSDKHEFQAETRMLLDIVAKSLYSEKEVFLRELISNASDALERLRYLRLSGTETNITEGPHEIHVATDKLAKTLTIQDTGVGMTKEEMIDNLGTIARSGSKAFLKELKDQPDAANRIIGQFGVGFYSSFMVGEKVDVFSKSYKPESKGYKWTSDGSGTYDIGEAEGVQQGTKIVIHLKGEALEFSDEERIKETIKKYSNFVGCPIFVNGKKVNTIQALWMEETKDVSDDMHDEFYRFISNAYDRPRFRLHYKTDSPINIRSLFYVSEGKPGLFDLTRESDVGVSLYSRKVLIQPKAQNILPKWLRFLKGVVDSEDIPLNLSRELLQDSALIRKLRRVLTARLLRYFVEQSKKDAESYALFYTDYGVFLREGIVVSTEQEEKEEIAKLLRFESSHCKAGEKIGLLDYVNRIKQDQKDIYYLAAPSRALAETSPYFEALKSKDVEVLFCFEPYDELVLMQLRQFQMKMLISVEKEMRRDKEDAESDQTDDKASLSKDDIASLVKWVKNTLGIKVKEVKITKRLSTHPCMVTVEEMGAARHFIRTSFQGVPEESRYKFLEPTLEINASHPIITKMNSLRSSDPQLAQLLVQQVFDNAMVAAGLIEDPRTIVNQLNELLTQVLNKV